MHLDWAKTFPFPRTCEKIDFALPDSSPCLPGGGRLLLSSMRVREALPTLVLACLGLSSAFLPGACPNAWIGRGKAAQIPLSLPMHSSTLWEI
jgi:hypothetical protein